MSARSRRDAARRPSAIVLAAALLLGRQLPRVAPLGPGRLDEVADLLALRTTKKILAGLKAPVRVTVFMTPRSRGCSPEVKELLTRYQALSPKIEVEYLDPERNPARAEALIQESAGVRLNTVVFRSRRPARSTSTEDKLADFDFAGMRAWAALRALKAFKGEEAFTSAIAVGDRDAAAEDRLLAGATARRRSIPRERGRGYSEVKQMLERDNMTVATWDSLGKGDLPAPTRTSSWSPGRRRRFSRPRPSALEKYLAGGGRATHPARSGAAGARRAAARPRVPGPRSTSTASGLGDDIVIDPANALAQMGAEVVLADRYGNHPIVRSLADEKLPVIFQLARSVTKAEKPPEGVAETMLVETSPEGWGETGPRNSSTSEVKKDPTDVAGPVSLAVAVGPADEAKPATPTSAARGRRRRQLALRDQRALSPTAPTASSSRTRSTGWPAPRSRSVSRPRRPTSRR